MNSPQTAALRFVCAWLAGMVLGLYYGFLRPLRPKHTQLSDLLFLPAAVYGWLEVNFRVCRGDLRPVWLLGMILGGLAWEATAGRLLRPVFSRFWEILGKLWD